GRRGGGGGGRGGWREGRQEGGWFGRRLCATVAPTPLLLVAREGRVGCAFNAETGETVCPQRPRLQPRPRLLLSSRRRSIPKQRPSKLILTPNLGPNGLAPRWSAPMRRPPNYAAPRAPHRAAVFLKQGRPPTR